MALAHADQMIELQSDLRPKEQPPEWMFEVPWVLSAHLKEVARKRADPSSSHDDEPDWEDEVKWDKNNLVPDSWR